MQNTFCFDETLRGSTAERILSQNYLVRLFGSKLANIMEFILSAAGLGSLYC